jgi:hypothetical protein
MPKTAREEGSGTAAVWAMPNSPNAKSVVGLEIVIDAIVSEASE